MTPKSAAAEASRLGQEMERELDALALAMARSEIEVYPIQYVLVREEIDLRVRDDSNRHLDRSRARRAPLSEDASGALLDALAILATGGDPIVLDARAELTTTQAAALIGISRPTLIGLLDRREIPFHLVGTHRRMKVADVVRYKDGR